LKNTLILAGILITYLTGTFGVFTTCFQSYHQSLFQQKVQRQEVEESEKLFFTFKEYKSISWIEKGKEFEWNGEMYDVNKLEKTNGGFVIYCENDGLEELLISFIKSIKREMEGNPTNLTIQPQFFQTLFQYTFFRNPFLLTKTTSGILIFYKSVSLSVLVPPPDFVIV
jgi:hypothetical protein